MIFFVQCCWVLDHSFVEFVLFSYQFESFISDPRVSVVFGFLWLRMVFFNCVLECMDQCGEILFSCLFIGYVSQCGDDCVVDIVSFLRYWFVESDL